MLMLIRFPAFWEKSFMESIGKPCGKIRVQSKQRFLQLNKPTSKEKSCDLKLELVTMLLWLVENKTKKQDTNMNTHSTTK